MYSRVLVADDDAEQREEMSEFLRHAGFDVITANDGFHALEQIAAYAPRVVLLDVNMPGWDGVRVAEAARNLDHRAVIILMTADVDALKYAIESECGAVGAFAKPVQLHKLLDFLESVVGRSSVGALRAG
jgi:DNA-binding response OmpR family regulator